MRALLPADCRAQGSTCAKNTAADATNADDEKACAFYHHNQPPGHAGYAPKRKDLPVLFFLTYR